MYVAFILYDILSRILFKKKKKKKKKRHRNYDLTAITATI